jgi:hypothetical protein
MTHLERILGALFWVPIFFGGIVGVALVEPSFHKIGIISAALLGVFLIFVLLQVALERRALSRSRSEQAAAIVEKPLQARDERQLTD